MDCIQIGIETKTEAVEALSYFLMEEGAGGVEICDPKDVVSEDMKKVIYDFIDESLLNQDMNAVVVKGYFAADIDVKQKIDGITAHIEQTRQFLDVGAGKITMLDIPEEKWINEWKKYYKPLKLGKDIVIKPTWENYTGDESIIIEMDPGMAFGTGTHETTAMCAELLESYMQKEDTILDIGTGSGILGIIAAKMGAKQVVGVDIDEMAVRVANENIAINNVGDTMEARVGDLLEVVSEKGDVVVSNIIADIIIMLSEQVERVMKPDGVWIASGIISMREQDVLEAIHANGWQVEKITRDKEWLAIAMKRG